MMISKSVRVHWRLLPSRQSEGPNQEASACNNLGDVENFFSGCTPLGEPPTQGVQVQQYLCVTSGYSRVEMSCKPHGSQMIRFKEPISVQSLME